VYVLPEPYLIVRRYSVPALRNIIKFLFCLILIGSVGFTVYIMQLLYLRYIEQTKNCDFYYQATIPPTLVIDLDARISTRRDIEDKFSEITIGKDDYSTVNQVFGDYITYCSTGETIANRQEYRCIYNIGRLGPNVSVEFNFDTSIVEDVNIILCIPGGTS
jgi:hypothetical protein